MVNSKSALQLWEDKLELFQKERAIATSVDIKFQLDQQIEECQQMIAQLGKSEDKNLLSPPLPLASLEVPGGTIPLNSQFYIRREPWESRSYQEITKAAGLVRIKAPRQMGKTSLMARIRDYAAKQGYRIATFDFQEIDQDILEDLNGFLKRFSAIITRKVGMDTKKISEYWDEDLFGAKENCGNYFQECLLPNLDTPLFLGMDELDRIFPYNKVAKEFLTLLRNWNEQAKVTPTWGKLRMTIVHSTESYVVMDTNSSPFNVGYGVELQDFTPAQILDLSKRHGLNWQGGEVEQLMGVVGGHPYLVRLAIYRLAQKDFTLSEILAEASSDGGIYQEHLRRHLWNLQQHPELAAGLQKVVNSDRPVRLDPIINFKLNGMGLVNLEGNDVTLRYPLLYRAYFQELLGKKIS
jgi:serine/threonine-protein kinase